ncbi:WD-40 repeat protein, partial [Reticulomyxa filosa]
MITPSNVSETLMQLVLVNFISIFRKLSEEGEIQIIIRHWVRELKIKLGWINDFDKIVAKYVILLKKFTGHTDMVYSIDSYSFNDSQFICSGSGDRTVRVWNVKTNQQIQLYNGHLKAVYCVKFSQYYYNNHCRNVICSSSDDNIIRFWDSKENKPFQILHEHTNSICGIEFSPFNGGRYLCSGSYDNTIRLWDVEISKSLHVFNGHEEGVLCVDMSSLQSNNNNNIESNSIGVIGGNGHENMVISVKYGSNELGNIGGSNTILSGAGDKSVRLWDIRSCDQIQ